MREYGCDICFVCLEAQTLAKNDPVSKSTITQLDIVY